jgi:hypothetical protein
MWYVWSLLGIVSAIVVFHLFLFIIELYRYAQHFIDDKIKQYAGLMYRADKTDNDDRLIDLFGPLIMMLVWSILACAWPLSIPVFAYIGILNLKRRKRRLVKELSERLP